MAGINLVMISGRLTREPETKRFNSGDEIAEFSIATSETWRDKNSGERKEKTEFHNIVVKGENNVKVIRDYVGKGDRLGIVGKLETRNWEKDGHKVYKTEIVVGPFKGEIQLIETKSENSGRRDDRDDDRDRGRGRDRDDRRDDRRRDDDRGRQSDRRDDRRSRSNYDDDDDTVPF